MSCDGYTKALRSTLPYPHRVYRLKGEFLLSVWIVFLITVVFVQTGVRTSIHSANVSARLILFSLCAYFVHTSITVLIKWCVEWYGSTRSVHTLNFFVRVRESIQFQFGIFSHIHRIAVSPSSIESDRFCFAKYWEILAKTPDLVYVKSPVKEARRLEFLLALVPQTGAAYIFGPCICFYQFWNVPAYHYGTSQIQWWTI